MNFIVIQENYPSNSSNSQYDFLRAVLSCIVLVHGAKIITHHFKYDK